MKQTIPELICEERKIFPLLYQTANRCHIQLEGAFTLAQFSHSFLHQLRNQKVQVSSFDGVDHGSIIAGMIGLKIIAFDDEIEIGKTFQGQLWTCRLVRIGLVLQPTLPAHWWRIQLFQKDLVGNDLMHQI